MLCYRLNPARTYKRSTLDAGSEALTAPSGLVREDLHRGTPPKRAPRRARARPASPRPPGQPGGCRLLASPRLLPARPLLKSPAAAAGAGAGSAPPTAAARRARGGPGSALGKAPRQGAGRGFPSPPLPSLTSVLPAGRLRRAAAATAWLRGGRLAAAAGPGRGAAGGAFSARPGPGPGRRGRERSGAGAGSPGAAGPGAARCTGPGRNPRNDGIRLRAGGDGRAAPLAAAGYELSIIRLMRR